MYYRTAKCIELHDSNITLTTEDESYYATAPTGRTDMPNKPAFSFKVKDLKMLAELLKIEMLEPEPGIEFIPIYKSHYDISEDPAVEEQITLLECQIVSDRLINIRITSKAKEHDEPYIEEMSYCGSFTIWWLKN